VLADTSVTQVQYFGVGTTGMGNPLGVPGADADGTGQTNLFKYTAGLNPTTSVCLPNRFRSAALWATW
jgi:hypothetical protein